MPLRSIISPVRSALIVVATVFLGQGASAQDNTDPFVQLRGGAGDQNLPYSYDKFRPEISWGSASDGTMFGSTQTLLVPPLPPPVGEALPGVRRVIFGRYHAADYEGETFGGGYAIVAGQDRWSATKETERIGAYGSARQQLLKEIRAKFEELAAATPAVRMVGLAELAAQQDTRLRALAGEEEAIRNDLAWVSSVVGIRIAPWTGPVLFDRSHPEFRRMFFGAYFFAGLSTEQRLLLPEIAYEPPAGSTTEGPGATDAGDSDFFFLPATTRILLPADLPPALGEKIRAFTREKEGLKSELRSAVLREDYFFISTRTRRLAALAEQQAPRFAALDALAEEIRVGLAGAGFRGRSENATLPADLVQRVGSFYTRKVEVQRELLNRLRQLQSEHPAAKFDIVRQGDGLAIVQTEAKPEPAVGLAEFNASLAGRYTALAGESEILRRDIQHYLENSPQRVTRTVDQLAADFGKAYAARANGDRERDYARAVLEPGLSAAQRRLLFQSAVAAPAAGSPQP